MVDIVVNHNGWDGDATSVDYSDFYPFNSQSQYHSYCSVDYSNQTSIQDCWLGDSYVELPDLRTEDSDVADGYQTWIQQLVANYSSKSEEYCFSGMSIPSTNIKFSRWPSSRLCQTRRYLLLVRIH